MDKNEIKNIEEFIKNLPKEKIEEINKKEFEDAKKLYDEFKEKFSKGVCSFCNLNLDYFNEESPCLHWLLCPNGFRKKHFKKIIENFNYSRIDAYLRWVASQDAFLKNINDLAEERRDSMVFEYSIKYKNIEWSFSCSKGDYEGHKNSRFGIKPHYHFQMKVDGNYIIVFRNFHIPLTDYDGYIIRARRNEIEGVAPLEYFGPGIRDLFENFSPEEILKHSKVMEDYEGASIHTSYMIEAEPGKKLFGDEIADLMEESKRTGTPLWNLLPKLKNVGTKMAIVSPGEGVIEISKRRKRGEKRNES